MAESKEKKQEPIPSTSKASNISRLQRNVAEKKRRDTMNSYISELATIVPMVAMASKRLDKTSILRLSAAHLRLSKSPLSGAKKLKKAFQWCPSFLSSQQVRQILESVDGFLIVTSSSGKILFTSCSVERYLGHQNIDMIGHSLFIFIHPDDVDHVKKKIEILMNASLKNDHTGNQPRCSFRCRMKEKGQPRSEIVTYQVVHFAGDMSIADEELASKMTSSAIVTHIFKAFVRTVDVNPYNQLSLEEATADEYLTRHSLDGTIIFADQRLSTITGHLPQEVIGTSAYDYILPEDASIALFAHHLMFSSKRGTGLIVYRLRTKDEKFVYLKTVGCLQFDRPTSEVDHFVCVNQHLNDAEGAAQLKYFADRYIPHVKDSSTKSMLESVKAVQAVGMKAPSSFGALNERGSFPAIASSSLSKMSSVNLCTNSIVHTPVFGKKELKPEGCIGKSDNASFQLKNNNSKSLLIKKYESMDTTLSSALFDSENNIKTSPQKGIHNIKKKNFASPGKTNISEMVYNSYINTHSSYNKISVPENQLIPSQDMEIVDDAIHDTKCETLDAEQSIQCEGFNNYLITSFVSQNINHKENSNYIQSGISIPDVSTPSYSSYQTLPLTEYDVNIVSPILPTSSSVHSINSDTKTHSGSVLHKSDWNYAVPTLAAMNSIETMDSANVPFVVNKINHSTSNPSTNSLNTMHTVWIGEKSSESSASNCTYEETIPYDLSYDIQKLISSDEFKNFDTPVDSTLLNSALPFEDSSLPSVDGWNDFISPEDILYDSHINTALIEAGDSFNLLNDNVSNL